MDHAVWVPACAGTTWRKLRRQIRHDRIKHGKSGLGDAQASIFIDRDRAFLTQGGDASLVQRAA